MHPRKDMEKCHSGIRGLDEVTGGGLPRGRSTLVCGGTGCGKTLMAMEFLVRGAMEYGDPGVFMCFEETVEDLAKNAASLGFDLKQMIARKRIVIDHVHIERNEIQETGEYDLEGLFVRLNHAIDSVGAKRVVLDTIENLFSSLSQPGILRAELHRLFGWLKTKGVTAIVTGEQGAGKLTRNGLEEYVSDCVIFLDHRVNDQAATRRLRVIKYRGSVHGSNEYPFLIDENGIFVVPITSIKLENVASSERISTGIAQLDRMLDGKGFYRGSTVLISGTAGTGKSTIASCFASTACGRGERCLYVATEESASQLMRNMRSVGIRLQRWVDKGLLRFYCARPMSLGLEMFLSTMHKQVAEFDPQVVILDPITDFQSSGTASQAKAMLMRLIDFLKMRGRTTLFTSLTQNEGPAEATTEGISSLIDSWLLLRNLESSGERNRGLYILKSRGMPHSNQIREFALSNKGVRLTDVYLGSNGMLTGSARVAREAQEKADKLVRRLGTERKQRTLKHKQKSLESRIAALRAEFAADAQELEAAILADERKESERLKDRHEMAHRRGANSSRVKS